MMIIISFILFALSAICNACMDKLAWHFSKSIFNKKDPKFWDPNVSWKYAKQLPFTKYKIDAWHLFKSAMIIFFVCSLTVTFMNNKINHFGAIYWLVWIVIGGLIWNTTFNLFFNRILSKNV